MKIDGKAIVGKDRETVNDLFSEVYQWSNEIDRDALIDTWSDGADCVELELGGDLWIVSDTEHSEYDPQLETDIETAVCRLPDCNWICNRHLFLAVRALSPLPTCEEQQMRAWKKRWFEIGSRESLELHMSTLPACARSGYVLEWIDGDKYGIRCR